MIYGKLTELTRKNIKNNPIQSCKIFFLAILTTNGADLKDIRDAVIVYGDDQCRTVHSYIQEGGSLMCDRT